MKYNLILLSFLLGMATYQSLYAQGWTDLNTGINDDLTGVVFWNNYGVVTGEKGIYYTTNGGSGTASWSRYSVSNSNGNDSVIYNNTQFYHCYTKQSNTSSKVVFACGKDTVSNKATLMRISLPSLNYSIVYIGENNSSLNNINHDGYNNEYYAVGDSGLIISFDSLLATIVDTSMTYNLTSISFWGRDFVIGTDNFLIKGRSDFNGFNYTVHGATGINNQDVLCTGQNTGYTVGSGYFQATFGSLNEISHYDFGSLNAAAIYKKNYYHFVATDHGIYRTLYNNYTILEWMPTAGNLHINDFWLDNNNATLFYACGKGGKVLVTNDNGGVTKPFVELSAVGRCVGVSVSISGISGSSSSCAWFIDGVQEHSGCNYFTHVFNTVGTYELKLIGYSNGLLDTSIQYINIVDPPLISSQISINDTLLCHKEPISITVNNAEQDVYYTLKRFGESMDYGSSPAGNGNSLTFLSDYLNKTGNYYLRAKSTLAECHSDFLDTIKLGVEQTKAAFYVGIMNAEVNEDVPFYENCEDAQNFSWSFPSNASISQSPRDTINTFSSVGQTQVTLRCWSDGGCMDSISGLGPTVYAPITQVDSCWINANDGFDGQWTGRYYPDIYEMTPSRSGYYICGDYKDVALATQHGDSIRFDNHGGYMAKYDFDGTVKWAVHSISTISARDEIRSVIEDKEGNVYICGNTSGSFVDNSGQTTTITTSGFNGNNDNYIIKLDSFGRKIWNMYIPDISMRNVEVDNDNNLIVTGMASSSMQFLEYIVNDTIVDTIVQNAPLINAYYSYMLMKFTPDGQVIWSSTIDVHASNLRDFIDVGFDSLDNIYLAGNYETGLDVYPADSTNPISLSNPNNYSQVIYLLKYDSAGRVIWNLRSYTQAVGGDRGAEVYDLEVDPEGNCYIAGSNNCTYPTSTHTFFNTDGTQTSNSVGSYYIAKINPSGICSWIQGVNNAYAYYGIGHRISLKNDELSVVGNISQNGPLSMSTNITSSNGENVYLTIGKYDYFISVYDTAGNVKKVYANGNNMNNNALSINHRVRGFFQDAGGTYYMAKNMWFFNGHANYMDFGTNISSLNGTDGVVTKLTKSCGIPFYYCPPRSSSPVVSVCRGDDYMFPDSSIVNNVTTTLTQVSAISLGNNCDSLVYTRVIPITIDTTVSINGNDLTVNQAGMTYQWLDCDNGLLPIVGETAQTYQATNSGNYAVIISKNNCSDTSMCYNITYTALGLISEATVSWSILPNPTKGKLSVYLDEVYSIVDVRITTTTGSILEQFTAKNEKQLELSLANYPSGVYFIQVQTENKRKSFKLIKY